ncbi:MAG: leucyl-tRNA synthetase [Granulosicoccus sp.]|jgi:leucyl-tRNA synthetase
MQDQYDFRRTESDVQSIWNSNDAFKVTEDPTLPKYYCLCMFPYPSGSLHMGHVRNYTIGDVVSRYKRMQGFNVLQPMGWDAFGLPAENAAIKNNTAPAKWTYANIDEMREQLQKLGIAYDWSRELATCTPEYYRWEQWFFTQLVKKGLAYKKMAMVNWDPVEGTVLANEQVDSNGCGWRSGAKVERRQIPQWFLKITQYADELLEETDKLEGWPEAVRTQQKNWIGRSEGVEFDFALVDQGDESITIDEMPDAIRVYSTRPDTVAGVTYMAVAAEHPVAMAIANSNSEVADFIAECTATGTSEAAMESMEKRGVPLGIEAVNPVSGERVPVFVANFVLITYGTGAVMAVPGHDQRDWDFAKKYSLTIKQVVQSTISPADVSEAPFTDKQNTVTINSGEFDGLEYQAAFDATAAHLVKSANGERKVNYRLRDWGVSRQRYWGCPIPIIYDEEGNVHVVPEEDLPVLLPEDVAFSGVKSPIKEDPGFINTTVPGTDKPGRRETDTFDTFFESSWYYARFTCPDAMKMLDERANYWLPVDQYIGGVEHAVMHLLYARFFHKLMRDVGLVVTDEPFTRLLTQGMVVAESFYRQSESGKPDYYNRKELDIHYDDKGRIASANLISDGQPVTVGRIEKMSKSKNNGVDPLEMISRYGADTMRLFSMSDTPPHQSLEWKEGGVEGMHRFLKRVWREVSSLDTTYLSSAMDEAGLSSDQKALRRKTHETIAKVTDDIERRMTFNTAIASMMELFNEITRFEDQTDSGKAVKFEACSALVRLLSPFVPHITHELWAHLGYTTALINEDWPETNESALTRDELKLVVQVNGKLRAAITVPADASKEACEAAALASADVQKHIDGLNVFKVIVVPGRLVNIVAK